MGEGLGISRTGAVAASGSAVAGTGSATAGGSGSANCVGGGDTRTAVAICMDGFNIGAFRACTTFMMVAPPSAPARIKITMCTGLMNFAPVESSPRNTDACRRSPVSPGL
jgi:hypothetical protein